MNLRKTYRTFVTAISTLQSDRGAKAFVWSVWLIMLIADLFILIKDGRIFPLNEDWWLVPPLTGHEPDIVSWLWKQNSEHRIPFPRLILLALLNATHGDFRAGMLFNIIIVAGLAFAMICVAQKIRGGRTSVADAFFPIALLHLGNSENLLWCWQLTQVVPTVLTCVVLLVLASSQILTTPGTAIVGGISLMLLPLSGSHALLFAPSLAIWFGYWGVVHWRTGKANEERQWPGGFLVVSAIIALCLTGLHFLSYEHPSWRPPDPTITAALKTAAKFLAIGFGPAARSAWMLSVGAIVSLLAASAVVLILEVLRRRDAEWKRAFGLLLFFGNVVLLALATGWGRATAIGSVYGQYPLRYVLMATPALFIAFFIWELYGPKKVRTAVLSSLFLAVCLLIPPNTLHGLNWLYWFADRDKALEHDLQTGVPASVLADRYREVLLHWVEPNEIASYMDMLHDAGIGPFAQIIEDSSEDSVQGVAFTQEQPRTQFIASNIDTLGVEIRYYLSEVVTIYLVWGINDWQIASEGLQPTGTEIRGDVMYTPMIHEGNFFTIKIRVPAGTKINYGFLISEKHGFADNLWPVWPAWDWNNDKGYRMVVVKNGLTEVQAPLGLTKYLFSIDFGRNLLFVVGIVFILAITIPCICNWPRYHHSLKKSSKFLVP
jgi:hypothetical protein